MRLAYLCNLYPAVSHSFVRREIESVEKFGHEVHRFSLRPARSDLKDEADLREVRLTETVLRQGALRLISAALALSVVRPGPTLQSIGTAWRLSGPGFKMKFRHIAYWLEAAWLTRRMDELKIEHLHCHFGTNPAAVAAIARAWGGPPFSFTVHGPDEFDAPIALSLGKKIEATAFVVAISSYCRSQLMRWSRPDQWHKIQVIRCGLDPAFIQASSTPIADSSTSFVCVARLSAQKGLPLLVAACDRLRHDNEKFTLTIIGDGELRQAIALDIKRRGLRDYVSLVGIRTSDEIRDCLASARAFVLPSFAEGLPIVLMEALAMSRPVIATAVAGISELIDEECGWIIPAGSEDALVKAMSAVLHAPVADLASKAEVGRKRVRELHNGARNAAQIVHAISQSSKITSTQ